MKPDEIERIRDYLNLLSEKPLKDFTEKDVDFLLKYASRYVMMLD